MRHDFLLHSIKKYHHFGKDMLAMSDMQKMPLAGKVTFEIEFTDVSAVRSCLSNPTVS